MPDIFADALRAKLQELQYGITSLHLNLVRKEHEELTQEVAELRNENRYLQERSHERVNWKGTKALRHQEEKCPSASKEQGNDSPGDQSLQVEPQSIAGVNPCEDRLQSVHSCDEDLGASASVVTSSPPRATLSSRLAPLQLTSVLPEADATSSGVGLSAVGEGSTSIARESGGISSQRLKEGQPKYHSESNGQSVPAKHHEVNRRSEPAPRPWHQAVTSSVDSQEYSIRGSDSMSTTTSQQAASRNLFSPTPGMLMETIKSSRDSGGWMSRTASNVAQSYANNLQALPVWQFTYEALRRETARTSHTSQFSFYSRPEDFQFENEEYEEEAEEEDGLHRLKWCLSMITVQPLSAKRIFWDVVSLIFIAWDMFFIPLKLFRPPDWQVVSVMLWVTRLFWTLDLPISFLTGLLMNDGNIEMDAYRIARRYTRTWLLPDIAMVVCDWLEIFVDVDMATPWRLVKLLRLYRLARILKIPETLALIGERIWSEQVLLVANFIKIVGLVLGVAHLIACFWYGVSQIEGSGDFNWVYQHGFEAEGVFDRYAMSFHWSLTQFVGGMDIVRPHNIRERVFAILVVLLTFIISAAVVSSITSSMTRLQFIAGNRSAQLSSLRRYLMDHRISRKLMMRIQRNAEHAMIEKQRNLPEAQVELLQLISEPLRVELHFEEHSPVLSSHPFFEVYTELCPAGMRKVCHHAITTKVLWPGDVLFSNGETPTFPQMYFICSGTLQYHPYQGKDAVVNPIKVHAGHWACEGVLWVRWIHRGMLRVMTESRIVALSATSFQEITCQFANGFHPGFYAVEFVEYVTRSGQVSDLGYHLEAEQIMRDAYDRILSVHNPRRSRKQSQHARTSRRSTRISRSEMKRSLRRSVSRANDDHSILGGMRATVMDAITEVGDKFRSTVFNNPRAPSSKVSRLLLPSNTFSARNSEDSSGAPVSASASLMPPTSEAESGIPASSTGLDAYRSGTGVTNNGSNTQTAACSERRQLGEDMPGTTDNRFSFFVTEVGSARPSYPAGQPPAGDPARLEVQELHDDH